MGLNEHMGQEGLKVGGGRTSGGEGGLRMWACCSSEKTDPGVACQLDVRVN